MKKKPNLSSISFSLALLQVLSLFLSCRKDKVLSKENNFLSFSLVGATSSDVDRVNKSIVAYMDDTLSRKNLSIVFQLSAKAKAYYQGKQLENSSSKIDLAEPRQVSVEAEDGTTAIWTISAESNYDQIGLGKVSYSRSVRALYNWYIDQGSSGETKLSDGGTASIAMAMQWRSPSYTTDFAGIRNQVDKMREFKLDGGPLNTLDLANYFKSQSVLFKVIKLNDEQLELKDCIDKGYIAILCLDMNKINFNPRPYERVEKFYNTTHTFGHFVVVKGYKLLENASYYYEIYDPMSLGARYRDNNELKGKDSFYHSSYLNLATQYYWPYAIVVGPQGFALSSLSTEVPLKDLLINSGN